MNESSSAQSLRRLGISPETIAAYDKRIPRYTSYPTAPVWTEDFGAAAWAAHLDEASTKSRDLSLYVHIPFCQKRCLFCACNVIATRMEGIADSYLDDVEKEVDLVRAHHRGSDNVIQLHLGGGTPNYLTVGEMDRLLKMLGDRFHFDADAERSIEIDPRIASRADIFRLHEHHGFSRISFGVQDFNDETQAAIGREQSHDISAANIIAAREAGFGSINIDLIYGLPKQTQKTWQETLDCICELKPDRIALYNFALLPGRLPHQRKLEESALPSPDAKVEMFMAAHERLTANGWMFIGMDHYARHEDSLARAMDAGTMRRNFMGYTTLRGTDLVGFGISAISDFQHAFAQNTKKLNVYTAMLSEGLLPVERGMRLSADDVLRQDCIERLMCQGRLDLSMPGFAQLVEETRESLQELESDGLLTLGDGALVVTLKGRVFLRNIAVLFDAYMRALQQKTLFSRSV